MDRLAPLAPVVAVLGVLIGAAAAVRNFLPVVVGVAPRTLGLVSLALTVVTFLLSPVAVFAVGYWAGTRVDVAAEYGRLALRFGLVGAAATALGFVAVVVLTASVVVARDATGVVVLSVTTGFFRLFDFAITGVAGAAVAHFQRG